MLDFTIIRVNINLVASLHLVTQSYSIIAVNGGCLDTTSALKDLITSPGTMSFTTVLSYNNRYIDELRYPFIDRNPWDWRSQNALENTGTMHYELVRISLNALPWPCASCLHMPLALWDRSTGNQATDEYFVRRSHSHDQHWKKL